jgi:hypothetical protein
MGFHGGTWGPQNPHISALGLWLSLPVDQWPQPQPALPSVLIEGNAVSDVAAIHIRPEADPPGNSGFHVVITDGRSPAIASAVRLNRYFSIPNVPIWEYSEQIASIYADLMKTIQDQELQQKGNLMILASFGMDLHLYPSPEMVKLLQRAGAGNQLEAWRTDAAEITDWGDESLCNYILAGYFGSDADTSIGVDLFAIGPSAKLQVKL